MRLFLLLGLIPLVATDYALALSLAQIPISVQESSQVDEICFPERFRRELAANNWQEVNAILAACDFATMSEADIRLWLAVVKDTASWGTQQQQIIGFHALGQIQQRANDLSLSVELTQWLVEQISTELRELSQNSQESTTIGESDTNSHQNQNPNLHDAVQATAVETLGLFTVRVISQAEATQILEEPAILHFSVPSDSDVNANPISVLLSLTSSDQASLRVNLAASQALREIGRALQAKIDVVGLSQNQRPTWDLDRPWATQVVTELEDQISAAMRPVNRDSERTLRAEQQLFTATQVARVEALSAFLFISDGNSSQNHNPVCPSDIRIVSDGIDGGNSQTYQGIQFLNCLSAQAEWEISSGESVEIDPLVRATAIAEIERLATIPTFRPELAVQLRDLARQLQGQREQPRQREQTREDEDANLDELEQREQPHEDEDADLDELGQREHPDEDEDANLDELRIALSISATELLGRVGGLPNPSQPQIQSFGREINLPEAQQSNFIGDDDLAFVSLPSLLAEGLNDSNNGNEFSELRQRSEIIFDRIYGRNLDLITQAIYYADGSGNETIQEHSVAALGAVNYRELKNSVEADVLEPIAQFLGQSLLCSEDAEVRRDAAFALGQLAPHYPNLFNRELANTGQAPFGYQLISDSPPESWGNSLVDICQSIGQTASGFAEEEEDAGLLRIIDALMLRLNDREENIVVVASYALSQYGIALESRSNAREFLSRSTNAAAGTETAHAEATDENDETLVSDLKTCMMALVSPTRYGDWPDEFPDDLPDDWPDDLTYPSLQSLVEKTEEYVEACPYLLPEQNQTESSIAAAFVLGQLGISDGHPEASDEERETVGHLLRSLQGRDLLAQIEAGTSPLSQITAVNPLQGAYPFREDSARDGIVSYALGQIHPREDELIQQLISAILFEQPLDSENATAERTLILFEQPLGSENATAERTLSCASVIPNDDEDYFACIEDPITRAAIIGAIEIIGLETDAQAEVTPIPDQQAEATPILDQQAEVPDHRRDRIRAYSERLRQLLTQDVSPVLTEAVVTAVIDRMVSISSRPDDADSGRPDDAGNEIHDLAISEQFATNRYILSTPISSIYSCAGASLGLARLGVYDTVTINQLIHYLYSFPEPLTRISPPEPLTESSPPELVTESSHQGNFCVPALPEAEAEQISDDLPSRLEQLITFKTGAIAALGAIGLNSPHSPTVSHSHDQTSANGEPTTEYTDQDVKGVVACLVDIANLEMLAFHENSYTSCQGVFADNNPAIQERTEHTEFPDTELSQAERRRAIRVGLITEQIGEAEEWGLTVEEMIQANELNIKMADRAYAKLHNVPIDFLREGLELEGIDSLTVNDLIRAWRFGIRSTDEILEGRRWGLLIPEVIQAAKWGLTPQEFFILKVQLQEPAIAAIGQLAIIETIETGASVAEYAALRALSFTTQDNQQQVTGRSAAGLQGLSVERIKDLKLRNLEAILLALQGSSDEQDQDKIEYIISQYLIEELAVDRDEYPLDGHIDEFLISGGDRSSSNPIDALADGLEQEVEQLVYSYQRAFARIPEEVEQDFPDPSSQQYQDERDKREEELRKTYTEWLQQRARELWEYDIDFRDEVLEVLVNLESETISGLSQATRTRIIEELGVGRHPEQTAQQCLSTNSILIRQRSCNGLVLESETIRILSQTTRTRIIEELSFGQLLEQNGLERGDLVLANATINSLPQETRGQIIEDFGFEQRLSQNGLVLESATISRLSQETRERIISELNLERRSERMAQQCLSDEDDLLTQERLCAGLARLITAALNPTGTPVSTVNVDASVEFLQTLAIDPEQDTELDGSFVSSQFEIERSSSVIRSSAIESLGQIQVSYASSQESPNILLARLADDDEQRGAVENAIQAYYMANPESGIESLIQALNPEVTETTQRAAAQMVAHLGQRAYGSRDEANDEVDNLSTMRWQIALQNAALVDALTRIARNSETYSDGLRADVILALGSIRSNDEEVVNLLRNTLLDEDVTASLEMQIAAARALGYIGQSDATLAGELQADLLPIVNGENEEPSQLRAVAAFSLATLNVNNTLTRAEQFDVVYSLISLFREAQASFTGEDERIIDFQTRRALVLYALGQFELNGIVNSGGSRPSFAERNLLEQVAETYAAGLSTNNPLAVRIVAASFAKDLPVWDDTLVNALIAATQDTNPAIRLAAVETIQLRQSGVLERSSHFDVLDQDAKLELVEALVAVFWNSQEYGLVRLAAGRALKDELDSEDQGTLAEAMEELGIDPRSLPFADILVALENLEEFSSSLRDSSGLLRGSDAILQAVRSADLLAEFDSLQLSQQLLYEILEAIRAEFDNSRAGATAIQRTRPETPLQSLVRIIRDTLTRGN